MSKLITTEGKEQRAKNRGKSVLFYIVCCMFFVLTSTLLLFHSFTLVSSEPNCDSPAIGDIDYCLEKIQREIDALKPAHEYNKKELSDLEAQIASLTKRINALSAQLKETEKNLTQREEDLAYAKRIFEEKTKNHYKFIRFYDAFSAFIASSDASEAFREINFRQKAADEDRKTMGKYATDIYKLQTHKTKL